MSEPHEAQHHSSLRTDGSFYLEGSYENCGVSERPNWSHLLRLTVPASMAREIYREMKDFYVPLGLGVELTPTEYRSRYHGEGKES